MKTKISKEQLQYLLYEKKMRVKDLPDYLNISNSAIRLIIKEYDIAPRSYYKIKADEILTIDYLNDCFIKKLKTIKEISDESGIPSGYVFKKISEFGLKKSQGDIMSVASEKKIKTIQLKYGKDNVFQINEIKEKSRETSLKKHGFDYWNQNIELRENKQNEFYEKHGVRFPNQILENREKISKSLKNANWNKIHENREKSCLKKYGVTHSSKDENIKIKITQGVYKTLGVEFPIQNEYIKNKIIKSKLENGYLINIDGKTIKDISNETGITINVLSSNLSKKSTTDDLNTFISNYKSNKTSLELYIEENLKLEKFDKKTIGYRPDFKLNDKTYLNVDGLYWHSELKQSDKKYHFKMRKEYEKESLRIFQFREDEIYNKLEIVKSIINNACGQNSIKIYGRNTHIKEVYQKDASIFLDNNHLMGSIKAKHVGLFYNEKLVSLLSYKQKGTVLKIERFCSKINYIVIGALSKLIKDRTKNMNIDKIESWVDLRYGNGQSLELLGFKQEKETLGWKWVDLNKKSTHNRLQCRANMDNRKFTESEHAEELGWIKIYDAGQRLYIKKLN